MPERNAPGENAPLIDVRALAAKLEAFAVDRNWGQFHSPKNLVMALTGELGELAELFQWMSEDESRKACEHPATAIKVEHELADVLLYLVRLADVLGVDLNRAASQKLKLNAEKYPIGRAYGSNKKYDEL
ncbi:MAG: nucleotide pyrophosphohydrolase [Betaproteobacteria bacterium]|nr:nucleotide pyrophosphohydrolase [Betaproteobacteria bacterium]